MRIACVGGGPAGLYSSVLMKLRDPGHDICVYERNSADTAPGWGVTFSEDLLRELRRSDPESARQIREAVICWQEQVLRSAAQGMCCAAARSTTSAGRGCSRS